MRRVRSIRPRGVDAKPGREWLRLGSSRETRAPNALGERWIVETRKRLALPMGARVTTCVMAKPIAAANREYLQLVAREPPDAHDEHDPVAVVQPSSRLQRARSSTPSPRHTPTRQDLPNADVATQHYGKENCARCIGSASPRPACTPRSFAHRARQQDHRTTNASWAFATHPWKGLPSSEVDAGLISSVWFFYPDVKPEANCRGVPRIVLVGVAQVASEPTIRPTRRSMAVAGALPTAAPRPEG